MSRILNKITLTPTNKEITKKELSLMNNNLQPTFKDFTSGVGNKKLKILVLGNSLLSHETAEDIGWTHTSSMAASTIEKDYVHQLSKKISQKFSNDQIVFRISNFADFERYPKVLSESKLDSLINFKPEIIIIQLGENVSEINLPLFEKSLTKLIETLQKDKTITVICTTPFFPSLIKNKIISKVTLKTDSYLVDLSNLVLLNSENYAENEKQNSANKATWKTVGIGKHPGDIGMENIAELLFITVNKVITEKRKD